MVLGAFVVIAGTREVQAMSWIVWQYMDVAATSGLPSVERLSDGTLSKRTQLGVKCSPLASYR